MRPRFKQNASSGIRVRLKRNRTVCSALQLQLHDPVADMLHHRQVMGDEEEAEASLLLQFFEQVDDVSLQADIIHLLKKLQEERGLSLLLISHDLPMVEHISDRIVKL